MMNNDLDKRLEELEIFREEFLAGMHPVPTALGPNKLSKNSIRARSITGTMMDVSRLSAVATNTGDLNVSGDIVLTNDGVIRKGKTSFDDTINPGYWIGSELGVPKFIIGREGGISQLRYDGNEVELIGKLVTESGQIAGWDILTTEISHDAGAIGLASVGSTRIWVGSSTPGSAPFRVSSAGAMVATSGQIGGWNIDGFTGIRLGSGSSERGIDTGSTAFYAGGSPGSANFRVTTSGFVQASDVDIAGGQITIGANFAVNSSGQLTASGVFLTGEAHIDAGSINIGANFSVNSSGNLTAANADISGTVTTGNLTATGGTMSGLTVNGNITIGSSGQIRWHSNTSWIDNDEIRLGMGTSANTMIRMVNSSYASRYGEIRGFANSSQTGITMHSLGGSSGGFQQRLANVHLQASHDDTSTLAYIQAVDANGGTTSVEVFANKQIFFRTGGYVQLIADDDARLMARGNIFPGNVHHGGSGTQNSRYMTDTGSMLGFQPGSANILDTAGSITKYWRLWLNGVQYRIALYAD